MKEPITVKPAALTTGGTMEPIGKSEKLDVSVINNVDFRSIWMIF